MRTLPRRFAVTQEGRHKAKSCRRCTHSPCKPQRVTTRRAEAGNATISTVSDVFLDTNILVYGFDNSEPTKQQAVWQLLNADTRFAISTQVLLEFYVVLTRKLDPPVSEHDAQAALELLGELPVVKADTMLVRRAVDTSIAQRVSIWDAMIVEAAVEAGCTHLWTEDLADGSTLRGVQVVNPLA